MEEFSHLVRFVSDDGKTYFGDAILKNNIKDARFATHARVITGSIFGKYTITGKIIPIAKLLSPICPRQLGTIRCLGLNYLKHAAETNSPIPKYPVLFYKPKGAVTGPTDPIPVPPIAYAPNEPSSSVDYECELVVIIGKEGKNIPESQALDYVLGYTVGNDISQRAWQTKRGGGQWSVGKMFDGWAPIGPSIVSKKVIKNPNNLEISTILNGEVVQKDNTSDQIFDVKKAISFLSNGSTLYPGDIIFTGTPSGVGMGRKPQLWLKNNDTVIIKIQDIGSIENKVVFENGHLNSKL